MRTFDDRLSDWRQALLDLSNRNALLNYRYAPTRPMSLHLVQPDAGALLASLRDGASLEIVSSITDKPEPNHSGPVANGAEAERPVSAAVPLAPNTVQADLPAERLDRVALRLLSRARSSEQEQGVNTLFVAFGLLRWQETGTDTWRFAPLLLLPVRLAEHPRRETFLLSATGDDPEINHTLIERLRQDLGVSIAADLEEEVTLDGVLERFRRAVEGRAGWEAAPDAHLGIFQFHKLRMYADLGEHRDVAAAHAILQALASEVNSIAPLPADVPSEDELDRQPPEAGFTVLDADAAQLRVAAAVRRGGNVIVIGPPGTGKSQTIANVIAEAIAEGKTVLFVSEKAAAIEVVHRRLEQVGLGGLCLMLHSHKANKKEIILELGRRLDELAQPPAEPDSALMLRDLGEVRGRLDGYRQALHRQRDPLGRSVYWAVGQLAPLQAVEHLRAPLADPRGLAVRDLGVGADLFERLSRFAGPLSLGAAHPWNGIEPSRVTMATESRLRQALDGATARLAPFEDAGRALAAQLGMEAPATVPAALALQATAEAALGAAGFGEGWLDAASLDRKSALAADASARSAERAGAGDRVSGVFGDARPSVSPAEAIRLGSGSWLSRLLSSPWRALETQMKATARAWPADQEGKLRALADLQALEHAAAWFDAEGPALAREFGPGAGGWSPAQWSEAAARIDRARAALAAFPAGQAPASVVQRLASGRIGDPLVRALAALKPETVALAGDLDVIASFFAAPPDVSGRPLGEAPVADLRRWLGGRIERIDELDAWVQAGRAAAEAARLGLSPVLSELIERRVDPSRWKDAYRKHALTAWLAAALEGEPLLAEFDGGGHAAAAERFRQLDLRAVRLGAARVLHRASAAKRQLARADSGEPQILRQEYKKKARHKPLRRLFGQIPNLLTELKPCLMMSPLSVAYYLPADRFRFDLVIFDEASQVRPQDAVGAIMRGRQLVVAGDDRQLPPTTFFDRNLDDPEFEDDGDIRALESVLHALETREMPKLELLWHYRSRHEHLIAWSNHQIYDGKLVTFPNPSADVDPARGVHFVHVPDGVYELARDGYSGGEVRVNRIEADRVVKLIARHAHECPERSLGVVALGVNQKNVILEDRLQEARKSDPVLDAFCQEERAEPFFVKALEEVQGDERDVMIISVGFGKDRNGKLSHNFGPINQQGGERRLNVLVTRAREQVIVVSSIRGADIDPSRTEKRGPRLLKNYLDYAEHGPSALAGEVVSVGGDEESPFEEEVAAALERAGWTVHRQVGVSRYRIDLAVVDPEQPGRYLLGVECDGATYHRLKTVRDRDRLRQEVLENLGWTIHRVWSTEWMKNPHRELQRILDAIEASRRAAMITPMLPPNPPVTPDPAPGPGVGAGQLPSPELPNDPDGVTPYLIADLPAGNRGDMLAVPLSDVTHVVVAVVDVEGPIHEELLTRRLMSAWGYARTGNRLAQRAKEAIQGAATSGRIRRQGRFLWPAGVHEVSPRGATADGWTREVGHVPPEELQGAIRIALERALSLEGPELVVSAARRLGYARVGAAIEPALRNEIAAGLAEGRLEEVAGAVRLRRTRS